MSRTDLNDAPVLVPGDSPQNALASRQLVVEPLRTLGCRRVNSFVKQWTVSENSSKFNYDFVLTFFYNNYKQILSLCVYFPFVSHVLVSLL